MKKTTHLTIRRKSSVVIVIVLFLFSFSSYAQNEVLVSGTITDQANISLPGATIIEKGTSNGVTSDFDGEFSIEVSRGDATLLISYIGYEAQEVKLNGQSTIMVSLVENASALDEVVVVGYGSQKRSDVTGAVASANLEAFEEAPNTNIAQSLQGTVPGLNVGQVNTAGGTPEINIRGQVSLNGSQSVLIVLDGIQYNGSLCAKRC